MLDIKFIRENKDLVVLGARKKRIKIDIDKLISLDDERKSLLLEIEKRKAEQNAINGKITSATPEVRMSIIAEMKKIKDEINVFEEKFKTVMKEWQGLMLSVPNVPDMSVPDGEDDGANVEVSKWGEIPKFDFAPKGHIDLMTSLNLADFEKGAEVAGFRGYYLKNDAVSISMGLWDLASNHVASKGGWQKFMVPGMVKKEALMGTGYLPQGEDDLYKSQDGDYFSGTAEVGTMSYFSDKILDVSELPIKVIAFSTCYRREAGSHGKDVKGIIRVHEFYKIEQVILCEANHETSVKHHEELRMNAEEILQKLNLPYRVVVNCGGDLGLGQVKKYDIEVWSPHQERYVESHSCSYFHDFQARRLNIKYKDKDGKTRFVHSLNNTAIATPRILVSILENNQTKEGQVRVPSALRNYVGKEIIG